MSAAVHRRSTLPSHAKLVQEHATDVPRVLRALGLPVSKKGARWWILCPAHGDKSPSCAVFLGRNDGRLAARCWSCNWTTGDVVGLVAAVHRLDVRDGRQYREALDLAAAAVGLTLDHGQPGPGLVGPAPAPPPRPVAPVAHVGLPLPAFDAATSALLQRCPLDGSVAAGLAFRGVIEAAREDGWGELPKNEQSPTVDLDTRAGFEVQHLAADRLAASLTAAGRAALPWLVSRGGGLAYPSHRLLIPWRTAAGAVWMLQRRWAPVSGDEKPGPDDHGGKYREDARAAADPCPYGADSPDLSTAAEVWLVEGAVDALAVRTLNRRGLLAADKRPRSLVVLGLPGAQNWRRVAPFVLPLVAGRVIVVALDADPSGDSLVSTIAGEAAAAGAARILRRTAPPPAKDWADITSALRRQGALP